MPALAYTIFMSEGSAPLAGLLLTYASMLNDYIIGLANAYATL
jgi:p-aminobenzoyl-glutamate transporter AbgT